MKTIFAVLFLTYFDTFDIKRYSVFETRELAESEFERIKKILRDRFYNYQPARSEDELFEINDCMVKIEELEFNKPLDMRGYDANRNYSKNYPLVSVSYDEEAVDNYWYVNDYSYDHGYEMDAEDYNYRDYLNNIDAMLLIEEQLKGVRRRIPLSIPERF